MSKKYICIVKVNETKFVRYHVNNLISFVSFLDKRFAGWRWMNVFDYRTKQQLGSFSKNNRPIHKYIAV
ncbi:hypothetical protein [Arachidicoccus sp.]|uniref:hypothetical protein n=1 Tax=Arachidicoccus sp. TaxID=1872624 RepID=UPI003D21E253